MNIQPNKYTRVTAHVSMFGATLLFGINYWVAKGLMPYYFLPLQIIFLRTAGAFLLFLFFEKSILKIKTSFEKKDIPRLILAAFLGITMNQILFFTGLNLTTPVDTSLINSTNPLLVLVFSALLYKQHISSRKILGILFGAAGAIMIILYGRKTGSIGGNLFGNTLILANTICWSIYLVIAKPLMEKYHPFVIMRWIFFFGFLTALPVTFFPFLNIHFAEISLIIWGSVLYVVVGTTFLAYLFITYGLRKLSPSVVAFYTYMQPVIVAIIGIGIYGEVFTITKLIAMVSVFVGIYLVSQRK
jgi:drug/metabolite transporter (DMT)-like permease